jgi:hypothetical protein
VRRVSEADISEMRYLWNRLVLQQRMTESHKFICSNGTLTTADRLFLDLAGDELPKDPDVIAHFGFASLLTFVEQSKLLGLYKGLEILEVKACDLDRWLTSGLLVERILETFGKLPVGSQGPYFLWFIENQHRIFPPDSSSVEGYDSMDSLFGPARFLLEPSDRLKDLKDLQPCSKRNCFMLASLVIQLWHPPPGTEGPYQDSGFCACLDESEEETLGVVYQRSLLGHEYSPQQLYWQDMPESSINPARFTQFWQAFESGNLIKFMESSGFSQETMRIRHLATYLTGSTEVQNLPGWDLLTFLKRGDAAHPPDTIFTSFGFYRCGADPRIVGRLKRLYTSLLACVDILELQEAQTSGRLLEFAQRYVDVDSNLAMILRSCLTTVQVLILEESPTGISP